MMKKSRGPLETPSKKARAAKLRSSPVDGPGPRTTRLSLDLPEELHRSVKAKAASQGRTIRDVVLEFLTSYIAK